jgi:hypothetical protein
VVASCSFFWSSRALGNEPSSGQELPRTPRCWSHCLDLRPRAVTWRNHSESGLRGPRTSSEERPSALSSTLRQMARQGDGYPSEGGLRSWRRISPSRNRGCYTRSWAPPRIRTKGQQTDDLAPRSGAPTVRAKSALVRWRTLGRVHGSSSTGCTSRRRPWPAHARWIWPPVGSLVRTSCRSCI